MQVYCRKIIKKKIIPIFVKKKRIKMTPPPKKILIATDSFKGCLSAAEASGAIAEGIRRVFPDCPGVRIPVADGGEGFTEALLAARGGAWRTLTVSDPLGRPLEAGYGILPDGTAVIETAAASGLPLLAPEERNPLLTSTFGTGELVRDAIERGSRNVLVGLGGSATHDAGTGLLSALGFRFLDADGNDVVPGGGNLGRIATIDRSGVIPGLDGTRFTAACDVQTRFCGPAGAAATFAPQKGADAAAVRRLEEGTAHFATLIRERTGINLQEVPGSGAAGGLGGALAALLGACLESGIDLVLDAAGFDAQLRDADLVITGEGRIDAQSAQGKAVWGVLRRSQRAGVPVVAVCGRLGLPDPSVLPFRCCRAIADENVSDQVAMQPDWARKRIADLIGGILESGAYWMNAAK